MQTYALPWRRIVSIALSLALSGITELFCADIPVKEIVLYKHGIGYFERQGAIPDGEEARLDFKTADMNDVLKSLTVTDTSGGRVADIRYDSNETLDQRLERYPFKIGDQEFLSAFLDSIKGARLELKSGDHPVNGTIISARALETGSETDKRMIQEQVTLLLDSGDVANYDLGAVTSLRLLDAHLQEQLKQYLQTLAQAKSRDKRSIYIDAAQHGNRNLRISYISPTAIWKSSYRLTLQDPSSILEGWAIVDNTTDEDWNNVKLSVVSGRPISFISLLDTPRFGRRQVFELPEDRAAGPVVYGGSVDTAAVSDRIVRGAEAAMVTAPVQVGVSAAASFKPANVLAPMARILELLTRFRRRQRRPTSLPVSNSSQVIQPSSVEGATGATLGELFEYNFAAPVTIKKNQSAMLPFLQDKVAARKLLIYSERDGEHPVNAAEVTNNTSKTLDGGPITVYEAGAYAGEALFETLKAGDKRLIGYAVDYGTRVTTAFDSGHQDIREIHVKDGTLQLRYAEHQTRNVHHQECGRQAENVNRPAGGNRSVFRVISQACRAHRNCLPLRSKRPGKRIANLKVEQESSNITAISVTSSTPDFLLTIEQNKELSERGRKQLQSVIDAKSRLAEAANSLDLAKAQTSDLTEDQTRLRQNIDSLNRVKGQEDQVRKYSSQLADNETQLAKLRDQRHDLELRKANLETEVRHAIEILDF